MKRLALVLAAVAALACAAPSPARRGDDKGNSMDFVCGTVSKKLTYLFWPKGRSGLPSELPEKLLPSHPSLPDPTRPHVSVYRVGEEYVDSDWLLSMQILPPGKRFPDVNYVGRGAASDTTKRCGFSHGASWKFHIAHRKSTTKAIALTCRFRSTYGYIGFGDLSPDSVGHYKIRAHDKDTVFLEADTTGVPKLRWDASFCKRVPLPD